MDPKSWGKAIQEVGPSYGVIFALIALLGYLGFQGVPAVMALTRAIQQNTDITAASALRQEQNQTTIIGQHGQMINENAQILAVIQEQQKELNDQNTRLLGLEADERSRRAHDVLRGRE